LEACRRFLTTKRAAYLADISRNAAEPVDQPPAPPVAYHVDQFDDQPVTDPDLAALRDLCLAIVNTSRLVYLE
jgi:hypothetical protein